MAKFAAAALLEAMVEAIHASIKRGEPAHIPNFGTFTIDSRASSQRVLASGDVVITPPRNLVTFRQLDDE